MVFLCQYAVGNILYLSIQESMAVKKILVGDFIHKSKHCPVLDVRSPGEFSHAHIPGAYSLPLFSDEERKIVGTLYKQQGKQRAIKAGLDSFGPKMKGMVEATEQYVLQHHRLKPSEKDIILSDSASYKTVFVHCWRGGMRSAGVAWLLDLYGFDVYTLAGGYKAYRNWVLQQFENDYPARILGGYTGSNKTALLQSLQQKGQPVIDLEGLAHHKGSAFGGIGMPEQPSQEMFENKLAEALYQYAEKKEVTPLWLEDESQRIGVLNIPHPLWHTIRKKPVFFIDIPFEERLAFIIEQYGSLDKEKLVSAVIRIQKRLGPLETKNVLGFLHEENIRDAFRILLQYYDKTYDKALMGRENPLAKLNKINLSFVDTERNTQKLLECCTAVI